MMITGAHDSEVPGSRKILWLGIVLQVFTLAGFTISLLLVLQLMNALAANPAYLENTHPPEIFARMTLPLMVGGTLGLVGLGLITLAITKLRVRSPWLFWFLMIYGGVLLITSPFGIIFGPVFLTLALKHKESHLNATRRNA